MKFRIDLKIIFFLVLFYFTKQLNLYIMIMAFCFIHELTHILVGVILGFKIQEIQLMPAGFFAKIEARTIDYNKKIKKSNITEIKKIVIAIAGPLMNLLLILIFSTIKVENENIIYSNLLIFLFNLIPIFPLDGGRILKSIFKIFLGGYKAKEIMNIISNITIIILTIISSILILYYKNIAILIIILYLWNLIYLENKRFELQYKVYKLMNKI